MKERRPPGEASAVGNALEQLRTFGTQPIVRGSPEGAVIVFDRELRFLCAGGRGLATVGLTQAMVEGKTIYEVFPPEVAAVLEESYRRVLSGTEATVEFTFGDRTLSHRVSPLVDGGTVIAGIGLILDISQVPAAEQSLRDSEEHLREEYRRLYDADAIGHSGSWEWDTSTDVITWSDGLFAMHQLEATDFPGGYGQAAARVHQEDRPIVDAAMEACRQSDQPVRFRYRVARAGDGELRWFDSYARGVFRDGALVRRAGAVADITEMVRAQEQLSHDAFHDHLTGLPNRSLLLDRLDAAMARSQRYGREIAVLFCDLDGFKQVNDTGGHAAGDAVLIETANRLRQAVREDDTVARVGGDEFVLIIEPWNRSDGGPSSGGGQATGNDRMLTLAVADRVVAALRAPIVIEGMQHGVSVSIGITYPSLLTLDGRSAPSSAEILREADAAMYHAKRQGKDRVETYRDDPR